MFQLVTACCSRLGFRGRFLLLVGLSYVAQGFAALHTWDLAPHDLAPPWLRATLWIGAGVVAGTTAWRPIRDTNPAGWLALYVPPALWSVSYLVGWVAYLVPQWGLPFAYGEGLTYACMWALVVAVILVCADWPEPAPRTRPDGSA